MESIYILSCAPKAEGGGVYKYSLTDDAVKEVGYYNCDKPMYAAVDNNKLYVLLREINNLYESGVFSIDLQLENADSAISTNGECACHITVDKNDIYATNYLSGSIVNVGKKVVKHDGRGYDRFRQEKSHPHQIIFSNDKKFVLCCDLGLDKLYCYDRNLNFISSDSVSSGFGIRHAVFSKNGEYVYAVTELVPSICVFAFVDGKISLKREYRILCKNKKANGAAIRISKCGKFLYVSLREENAIVAFKVDNDNLKVVQRFSCGDSPRDFNIVDKAIIIATEKDDTVAVHSLRNGLIDELVAQIKLQKPVCCVVAD